MKQFAIIAILAMSLAGCNADKVEAIRAFASGYCGFIPSAASVAAVLAGNPAIATVGGVGKAICDAVTAKKVMTLIPEGKPAECPKVNDVCIEGEWGDYGKDE